MKISANDKKFSFSALHFSELDLYNAAHDNELVPRKEVIFNVDAQMMGLGNSSCGPGVLLENSLQAKTYSLNFSIKPF